jgi:hypothetical protein
VHHSSGSSVVLCNREIQSRCVLFTLDQDVVTCAVQLTIVLFQHG